MYISKLEKYVLIPISLIFSFPIFAMNESNEVGIRCDFTRSSLPSSSYSSHDQTSSEMQDNYHSSSGVETANYGSQSDGYITRNGISVDAVAQGVGTSSVIDNQSALKNSFKKNDYANVRMEDVYRKEFPESLFLYFSLSNNGNDLYYIEDEYNKIYLENSQVSNMIILVNLDGKEISIDRITGKAVLNFNKSGQYGSLQQSYTGYCEKNDFKKKF